MNVLYKILEIDVFMNYKEKKSIVLFSVFKYENVSIYLKIKVE